MIAKKLRREPGSGPELYLDVSEESMVGNQGFGTKLGIHPSLVSRLQNRERNDPVAVFDFVPADLIRDRLRNAKICLSNFHTACTACRGIFAKGFLGYLRFTHLAAPRHKKKEKSPNAHLMAPLLR